MNHILAVFNKYADFKGRATRSEYWYFILFVIVVGVAFKFIGQSISFPYLEAIFRLAVLLPSLAVGVRRMHDVNKSGWFLLIPFYNLILACTDSVTGPNKWGQDSKKSELMQEVEEIGSTVS